MADNQTIPATAFSVSGSADGFSVQGSYPFINEIRSEDTTIAVSNGDSSPVNIQVTIRTNASTGSVLEFIRPRQENEQGQTEEIPGVHELALNQNADGILVAGGGVLSTVAFPETTAVLVADGPDSCHWETAPDDKDVVLGIQDGRWHWYEIATCENACDDASGAN